MKNFDANNHTYQTGRTQPPKSRQGVIACLLILVILLSCAVSALSLLNIRLFRMMEDEDRAVRVLEQTAQPRTVAAASEELEAAALGFAGQEFTSLYRSYQAWPQGIYISHITPQGPAETAGVQLGDILVAINGVEISDRSSFEKTLADLTPEPAVTLTLFRDGRELNVQLRVDS